MNKSIISDKLAIITAQQTKEREYWYTQMTGEPVKSFFYYDYPESGDFVRQMEAVPFQLTGDLFDRLMRLSNNYDHTLYMVLVSGLIVLLDKYTYGSNKDILLGAPIYKQEMAGDLINTVLPLRNRLEGRVTFKELLLQVKDTVVDANKYQNFPIEAILEYLNMSLSEEEFPLFDIAILLENIHDKNYLRDIRLNMVFSLGRAENSIHGVVEYNASRFRRETIEGIVTHFTRVLEEALANIEGQVSDINILSDQEKKRLLLDFNASAAEYRGETPIHRLFEEQVERAGDRVAVVGRMSITYNQLNEKSHQLTRLLIKKGVEPGTQNSIVGIMSEGSPEIMAGILGILRAGGAYLPISPHYPESRKKYLAADSNIKILLTDSPVSDYSLAETIIDVNDPGIYRERYDIESAGSFENPAKLAYIMYTSGSTGIPKGSLIEHKSVVRLVKNTNFVDLKEDDRILKTGAMEFDASTFEIWGALLNGLRVYLERKDIILIPEKLKERIKNYRITTMWMTAPLFNQMADADIEIFAGLRNLLVGGDVLSPPHIRRVRERYPHLKVINGYGPTENTTFSTTHLIDRDYKGRIPIGKPIANSTAYIVDKNFCLVPPGAVGELLVGGDGVARGYLNSPELTADKFIKNQLAINNILTHPTHPTHPLTHSPIYRTGDLARWLPDGTIDFLGRIDFQVKIRGFRVEMGEIENHLLNHEDIREAVVIARKEGTGSQYGLAAYIVGDRELQPPELREYLSRKLPDYMIPGYFISLDKMPLTPNGKIDRKALPEPELKVGADYIAPANEVEEKLTEIWSEILDIDKNLISVTADFFDLGGHSLKANVVVSEVHKFFNVKIPLVDIFTTPTIRGLAEYITAAGEERYAVIEPAEEREYYALSPAQKRLYILHQMEPDHVGYNMPHVIPFPAAMGREKLEGTFKTLINRHESLRTSFEVLGEEPVQRVHKEVDFGVEYYEADKDGARDIIDGFMQPFDLSQAPLLKALLLKVEGFGSLLLLDLHHIITDGASQAILTEEFNQLYNGKGEGLPPLTLQYKDYALWQNSEENRGFFKEQEGYWLKEFSDEIPILNLPLDFPRPAVQSFEGNNIYVELRADLADRINQLVHEQGVTLYMVFLALFNVFLAKLSGQEDIVIGTPVSGRRHGDLQGIMGLFVNTLAVRNFPHDGKSFAGFLMEVKLCVPEAFENQEYPFEALVEKLDLRRDPGRNPLFDVMFDLEHRDTAAVAEAASDNREFAFEYQVAKFDLTLGVVETPGGLTLIFEYCTRLFKKQTMQRFIDYFLRILEIAVQHPHLPLREIYMVGEEEQKCILYQFNHTTPESPDAGALVALFQQQEERTPYRTAVACGHSQLTYRQLNKRANRLAFTIKQKGVGPDTLVGILIDRSLEMVIAVLAVLKAGGGYLALDVDSPGNRIRYIIEDSRPRLMLVNGNGPLPEPIGVKWEYLSLSEQSTFSREDVNPGMINNPGDLAYILYTSGTTGRPKGVMIDRGNAAAYVHAFLNEFPLRAEDIVILEAAFVFDVFAEEVYPPLLSGTKICVAQKEEVMDVHLLETFIAKNNITHFTSSPLLLNELNRLESLNNLRSIHTFVSGVDVLKEEYITRLRALGRWYNVYGPTEATVSATYYKLPETLEANIPIGKPIANYRVYILDKSEKLQGIGVPGEISIAGDGVGRGYLNQPELTAEKFVISHLSLVNGQAVILPMTNDQCPMTFYRTGDLGRWLPDGNLQFLGRIDQQVKVRGFRIELGEIESHLSKHNQVKEAVAIARGGGEQKTICAYYVAAAWNQPELFPSIGEYPLYDELLYYAMTQDELRNRSYKIAIKRLVKDKTVVEVGTGQDVILARFCVEAGAKKVYAVESSGESFKKARELVKKIGLEEKIILIHGDSTKVKLPEKVDVCVSEIIGTIGGSEGAAAILNNAFRFLKEDGFMIPVKCITKIAAVRLPQLLQREPGFSRVGAGYVEKLFKYFGCKFDFRICVRQFPKANIISNPGIFEKLDFSKITDEESTHEIQLVINKHTTLDGFLLWINLHTVEEELIDNLEKEYNWLPVFVPLPYLSVEVSEGDIIKADCIRTLSANNINPDYKIKGILIRKRGDNIEFECDLPYFERAFRKTPFHAKLFDEKAVDYIKIIDHEEVPIGELRRYLENKLPKYMVPSYFIQIESIPLTPGGKVDRKALPDPAAARGEAHTAPRDDIEKKLVEIWSEVLGVEKDMISIDADFFQLGGHSLKANLLVTRINRELDVKIPLTEIFKIPTIKGLTEFVKTAEKGKYSPIISVEEKDYYPLSSVQKRLFVLQQLAPQSIAYHMTTILGLEGELDKEKLRDCFAHLIRRHESLRTSLEVINGEPVQRVHKENYKLQITNYKAPAGQPIKVPNLLKDFVRPFDLSQAPLLRVGLIETGEREYTLIVDMHHIISDGTSTAVLVAEFMSLYEGKQLPGLHLHYKDYARWENREKESEAVKQQEAFWLKEFAGDIPILELPTDYSRPKVLEYKGNTVIFDISISDTRSLKTLASEQGATLYMVLLTIYNIFLARLSGQEVIVVGTPSGGRPHADLERVIGMFVNTLALKTEPGGEKTFREFLKEVKEKTLAAFAHQDYPYEELVEKVTISRDLNRNPLFDAMFILQNLEVEEFEIPGLKLKPYPIERTTSKFDFTLEGIEGENRLTYIVEYSMGLFKMETIQRFISYLKRLTSAVLENPDQKICHLDMVPEEEKEQLVKAFNDTAKDFPMDKTIYQLFEEQVDRYPDFVALVFKDNSVTLRHFDERANQLAHYLRGEKGLETGDRAAVLMERSLELIISLMGVMKAGGAYVPLDPSLPVERQRVVLEDASIGVVLSQEKFREKLTPLLSACQCLHSLLFMKEIDSAHISRPGIVGAGNPAYVMYTSGSTGIPKGVLVEHRSIVNTLIWRKNFYKYQPGDVSLHNPPYFFDSSISDIFTPLLGGARLVLVEEKERVDLEVLKHVLKDYKISHFIAVPAFYNILVEEIPDYLTHVKMVTVAGEHFPDELVKKHFERLPRVRIFNEYGPTENSVNSTAYELRSDSEKALIGKPISNVGVYILDRSLGLCPIGVTGEICLAGTGLARGYLNNPELTAEKFTRFYGSYKSYRTYTTSYKTGDLARWLPDGNLEFMGRADSQVKIRGIRVEMAEIENHLLKRADIKEAIVLAHEGLAGDKYLCAYVVPAGIETGEAGSDEWKQYLAERLPEYMVPSQILVIDTIPFTPGGKIDRKVLPVPEVSSGALIAPRNSVEKRLVEIWSEVLGTGKDIIGIDSDFFQLGGHSLLATTAASRIHKTFNVKIPLAEVFVTPTIRGLAKYITVAGEDRYASIEPVEKKEYYPLSSAQTRLYLLYRMVPGNIGYNMPEVVHFPGEIDKERLEQTFKELIKRHESLRTSFFMVGEKPVQKIHDAVEFSMEDGAWSVEGGDFVRPFDLSRAPLLRVGLIEPGGASFMIDLHHIISDGASQAILTNEFNQLYSGKEEDLPPLRLQYKDYSQWQNSQNQQTLIKGQEAYWLKEFSENIPVLNLPIDFSRPVIQSFEGNTVEFPLSVKESRTLKTLCRETKTTLYMTILSVFNILLARLSGQEDIIVGTPIAGRRHADLEPIIGMFVNTLAMRNRPAGKKRYKDFLAEVKERTLVAYENQEYQFEDLVDKLSVTRDTGRNPIFDVVFNLLNLEDYTGMGKGTIPAVAEQGQESYEHIKGMPKFDLTLNAVDLGERLVCTFEYCTGLFAPATIERFIAYFKRIVALLSEDPNQTLSELTIITETEKQQILYEFNDAEPQFPSNITILQLFEQQVEKTPDSIAVHGAYKSYRTYRAYITYDQLNRRSTQLAQYLVRQGVGENRVVGLLAERSFEMVVGILGILKAGGAYVPLNPKAPASRNEYILKECSTKILVSEVSKVSGDRGAVPLGGLNKDIEVIDLNETLFTPSTYPTHLTHPTHPTHLCYVIFTSGSTGKPKGVPVTHSNLCPLLHWGYKHLGIGSKDRVIRNLSYYFDWSVWEMFIALTTGAGLYMVPEELLLNPEVCVPFMSENEITILHVTPPQYQHLIHTGHKFESLKYLFLGAEKLTVDLLKRSFASVSEDCRVFNMYGPTEATIISAVLEIPRGDETKFEALTSVPIGQPAGNAPLLVLDRYLKLCPVKVTGELYIAGDGLANGYLNDPEKTHGVFVKNLYQSKGVGGDCLYKTGDLVRWLPDGNVEFLGRIDHQIKIRGYRIELGEIENQLLKHPEVKDTVVIAGGKEEEERYLAAYIVFANKPLLAGAEAGSLLREFLSRDLPDYMVPSFFVPMDKIPLTPNGKVDRRALPEPEAVEGGEQEYIPPGNEVEAKLVEIWSELLGIEKDKISINVDFFRLGGHSLKAAAMMAKIQEVFQIKLDLVEIFSNPTARETAALIKASGLAKEKKQDVDEEGEELVL